MDPAKLLIELNRIVETYVDDKEMKKTLTSKIERRTVKYIISEIEKHHTKEFTDVDKSIMEDLYFNFC